MFFKEFLGEGVSSQVKVFAQEPGDQNSILSTHIKVEGEKWRHRAVLWLLYGNLGLSSSLYMTWAWEMRSLWWTEFSSYTMYDEAVGSGLWIPDTR